MYYLIRFWLLNLVVHAWNPELYAYHPQIHMFGNHGIQGKLHAELSPFVTKLIDEKTYGIDIRKEIKKEYEENNSVLDLCCGTGFSTPEHNTDYFHLGIDISKEMIDKANHIWTNRNYQVGNAETFYTPHPFDIVTIFFAFHEIPQPYRLNIIENAKKNARKKVMVVDICPDYKPSYMMLMGEPYINEYLKNIDEDLKDFEKETIIKGHVVKWTYNL